MADALKIAPRKCLCGARLPKPAWGNHWRMDDLHYRRWYIDCPRCVITMVWSWPNVWKARSTLPLFDSEIIVAQ